jgi:single-stranded-DNA-specific exonuclease
MTIIDKNTTKEEILGLLLKNRHISKDNEKEYLSPSLPQSFLPKEFGINHKNLDKAVSRIKIAIKNKENILIYGDYDVDGITATAILWQVLYDKKANIVPFIPDREQDGYGVKADSFFKFQTQKKIKFDLLITVDNGIVANSELQKILDSGVDIIVSDHHLTNKPLPKSIISVHSTKISGSVVAWLIAQKIDQKADLGLASLGAVADCLPLNTINRNIVYHGLKSLQKSPNYGINKLIEISGIKQDKISTYELGFVIGPRLNAVGRLSNPTDALRLLCSTSNILASKYATILDSFNKDRQLLQQDSIDIAQKQVKENKNKVIFISDNSFLPGIIGLIASRFTEKYYLPSIVISIGKKISKGSCRSIKELNIIETLRCVDARRDSHILLELGGHAGAAGFSIETKKIPQFKKEIIKIVNLKLKNKVLKPTKFIDADMKLDAVTIDNCRLIQKLEPFGVDNLEPLFKFDNLRITEIRLLGQKQEHLKLKVDDPSTPKNENILVDTIAFKKGDIGKNLKIGDTISFTAKLNLNFWNNKLSPQLIVSDILSL